MPQTVEDIMTKEPRTVEATQTIAEAARAMRDADVGVVLVLKNDQSLCGIITDRDITTRVVAEGSDPTTMIVEQICTHHVLLAGPRDQADQAETMMRNNGVRRLAVVDAGRPVGILSVDDLAVAQEPRSPLAQIAVRARHRAEKASRSARTRLEARKTSHTKLGGFG